MANDDHDADAQLALTVINQVRGRIKLIHNLVSLGRIEHAHDVCFAFEFPDVSLEDGTNVKILSTPQIIQNCRSVLMLDDESLNILDEGYEAEVNQVSQYLWDCLATFKQVFPNLFN